MNDFILCFIPLFVAVDAIGLLPLYVGMVEGLDAARVRKIIRQSALTAGTVALLFQWAGPAVLKTLGITVEDFMVAGGILLFVIAVGQLFTEKSASRLDLDTVGAVPLGVPLITGPGVLTTSILLAHQYGHALTAAATILNIGLAALLFFFAPGVSRLIGTAGAKTLSKIAALLLAAIGVMMVRRGLALMIG